MPDDRRPGPGLPRQTGADRGRRATLPPLTADESEKLWQALQRIEQGQTRLQTDYDHDRGRDLAWRTEVNDKLEEHDKRLAGVEDAIREAKDARLEFKEANGKLDRLLESDAKQDARIGSLELTSGQRRETVAIASAEAKAETATVNASVNRKLTLGGVAVLVLTAFFQACGNAMVQAVKDAIHQ